MRAYFAAFVASLIVAGCDDASVPRHVAARPTPSVGVSESATPSTSIASTAAEDAPPPTFTDGSPTLHLATPLGPFPTLDDACDAIAPSKQCERASIAIAIANAPGPFVEVATLLENDFVHPAVHLSRGWYVAVPARLEELRQGRDVDHAKWNILKPIDARTEDVIPGGEPEIVVRFTQQIDRPFNGAKGDYASDRKPSWLEEIAIVCAVTPKVACIGPILGAASLATAATGWVLKPPPHVPVPHLVADGADWSMKFPAGDVYVRDVTADPKSADGVSFRVLFP